jgi:hypothetical protein
LSFELKGCNFEGVGDEADAGECPARLNGDLLFVKRADVAAERDAASRDIDREALQAGSIGFGQLMGDFLSERSIRHSAFQTGDHLRNPFEIEFLIGSDLPGQSLGQPLEC